MGLLLSMAGTYSYAAKKVSGTPGGHSLDDTTSSVRSWVFYFAVMRRKVTERHLRGIGAGLDQVVFHQAIRRTFTEWRCQ
jgi:hypothetical protein